MYIPKFNSYFIHIPKCGGSSIEQYFFNLDGLYPNMENVFGSLGREVGSKYHFGNYVRGLQHSETQHLSVWDCRRYQVNDFLNSNYKFAFVRNPWHRFVSEVHWKRKHLRMTNHSFQDQIEMQKRFADNNLSNNLRPHNTPQWKFVFNEEGKLAVDDVFKLEEIDKAEKRLSEVFGVEVKFPHVNKTEKKNYEIDQGIKNQLLPLIKTDLEVFGYE
jgi:hypothetical protein